MDKRSAESPMDFEWQTRAPGDATSPFYQLGLHNNQAKKRSHSIFDSPGKKQMPSLREPHSQPFLFSQPHTTQPTLSTSSTTSPPKPVFGQAAFMTPRKFELDFSSGAENISSPENADNDDTPEQTGKPAAGGKRNSLFGIYGRFAPSPGRGEIPRLSHYSNALARRVQKRRRRDRELDRRIRVDDDEEEDSDRPSGGEGDNSSSLARRLAKEGDPGQKKKLKPTTGSRWSSFSDFFALLEAHPHVPSILSWWAQLVVNLSLFSLAVYVVFGFVSAIRAEFDQAAEEVSDTILAEMATCAKNYVENRCGGGDRLPALETVCENWERCMNRDPAKVGRAKVSAHTMAIIINSFIDPISWKAIMFFLATISTVTVVSNWSFRSFRNRLNQHEYPHPGPVYPQQPPGQQQQQQQHLAFPSQLHLQNTPGFGYFAHQDPSHTGQQPIQASPSRVPSYGEKAEQPLMIEDARPAAFVTERSRERESHLRTPSPSKRDRRLL